ncbi:MAG: hypothetical protein ACXVBC_08330 [Bdellovibrionota bacterium]
MVDDLIVTFLPRLDMNSCNPPCILRNGIPQPKAFACTAGGAEQLKFVGVADLGWIDFLRNENLNWLGKHALMPSAQTRFLVMFKSKTRPKRNRQDEDMREVPSNTLIEIV